MARPVTHPTTAKRSIYHGLQQESELVAALLRTVLIILAVLAPTSMSEGGISSRLAMQVSIIAATVYNAVIILLYWRRVQLHGQRVLMLLVDVLLVTVWIRLTWDAGPGAAGSPLFPYYYVIVLVSALWFGVSGVLSVAALISVCYLIVSFQMTGNDPFTLIDALYRQIIYIFLVAITASYLVDTHKREREQWTRSQVLLAQYQERFRAAQEVYELLIPSHAPQVAGLDVASRWRPALQEGGGDFYDVITPAADRVVITIADVSGKHSRGAIKLPLFKAAFLATSQVWGDPGEVLAHINRIVYPLLQPDMFISACVVMIDFSRQRLVFANAGQDPPIFIQAQNKKIHSFETGGLVLGVDEDASYQSEEFALSPGDTLCLYTDGITEARSPSGEEFGYETLQARVLSAVAIGLPAEGIAENIYDAVVQHVSGGPRHDDMTLLVVRYHPEERA